MSSGITFPVDNSETLDREDWLQIATDLLQIGPVLREVMERVSTEHPEAKELYPAMDPDTFEADMRAACVAVAYVAEFAADKCRFIPVEEE